MTQSSSKKPRFFVRWQYVIEIVIVILFALLVTSPWQHPSPELRLIGGESEWLISSATVTVDAFRETGRLTWWQPYILHGYPMIDEAMSFVLNPMSFLPSLLLGTGNGIPVSIILSFIVAGIGGWFLGWSLNWGFLGRLTLALLLILKGNMQSTYGMGFYQMGIKQAFFPWIFAGVLAIARYPDRRWPQVLFALSFTLLLFSGNLYYTLPMAIVTMLVVVVYIVDIRLNPFSIKIQKVFLRRFLVAVFIMAGLMAVTALTILLNFSLLGNHPNFQNWQPIPLLQGLWQFVNPEVLEQNARYGFSYTYVAPLWFVVLLFVLLPPIKLFHRLARPDDWRLWVIAIAGLLLFTSWGMGINPIIIWMYENLPVIGQWRFVERMLAISTFLFAFLIAFRVDGLYRSLSLMNYKQAGKGKLARGLVLVALSLACVIAVYEVSETREQFGHFDFVERDVDRCIRFLREQYPEEWLTVWRRDYNVMTTLMTNRVRMAYISGDFDMNGVPSEIYPYDLTGTWPEFRIAGWYEQPEWLRADGYYPLENSPMVDDQSALQCVWRNPNALGFAFSATLTDIRNQDETFDTSITTKIEDFERTNEHIAIVAMPTQNEETVVVAQDIAYPGWIAKVNGEDAKLESIGGFLGVILPPGDQPALVEFIYTAPTLRLGGIVTLLMAFFCTVYLLQLDKIPARFRVWQKSRAARRETVTASSLPVPLQASTPNLAEKSSVSQLVTSSTEIVAKPAVIRTNTIVRDQEQSLSPTLEVHVTSGRHRVVFPPSEEPLVVEVVVEKQRWLGINAMISILFAGLIGANAMQWFSSKRRNKRD